MRSVSSVVSPVTQVAEFEVKYASKKFVKVPAEDDTGRHNSTAPVKMTAKKLIAMSRVGLNLNILYQ